MKFQINVSQHDIDNSERGKPNGCMIHSAFMRATDGTFSPDEVYVDAYKDAGWYIHVVRDTRYNELMYLRKLPGGERLDEVLWAWDNGYTVEPFSFWIELPDHIFQLVLVKELFQPQWQQVQLNLSKGE